MLNLIGDLQKLNINYNCRDNYDLEVNQDRLYLAGISLSENREFPQLKILTYDRLKKNWEEIYAQKIKFQLEINNYQIKFIKLNNLSQKDNLFLIFTKGDEQLTLRLEDDNFFRDVTQRIDLSVFINQLYINHSSGIYAIEKNNLDAPLTANLKYWSDWSQEEVKNIKIPEELIEPESPISQINFYQNSIYLGRNNLSKGIDIYRLLLDRDKNNNSTWQAVIIKGAYRYSLNQKIFAMTVFQDCLYLACGFDLAGKKLGQFKLHNNGFELIRIYEDNDWDIIAGSPKFSPQGLKVPLSTLDCGFGYQNNIAVDSLIVHKNKLCLWTKNIDNLQFWQSHNGEDWQQKIIDLELNSYGQVTIVQSLSSSWGLIAIMDLSYLDKTQNIQIFSIEI